VLKYLNQGTMSQVEQYLTEQTKLEVKVVDFEVVVEE
jgi:uncharacterized protein (DUF2164 family)